jgi:hypothetical protein
MENRLIFLYHLMVSKPGGRRKLGWPPDGWRFKGVGGFRGKCNLGATHRDPMSWPYGLKQLTLSFQEKPRIQWSHVVPVPQTDSGGRGENPQALERTLAKELGKLPP